MSNSALQHLSDKIDELEQQKKRYKSSLEYLARMAKQELEKEETPIEAEIIALEIVKVFEDVERYEFKI